MTTVFTFAKIRTTLEKNLEVSMGMNRQIFSGIESALASYHERFEVFFGRAEPREQSRKYIQSLIIAPDRRNGWELAEAAGDSVPDPTQRLMYRSHWDVNAVLDEHIRFAHETIGHDDGVFVVDETGFLKSGNSSAGVQRQYTGTAGKVTNCQVGVFLGYNSIHGSMLLDRRLYMPQKWLEDPARCSRAKVPESLSFRTKPQQALEMIQHAITDLHFPGRCMVGDEVYGNDPKFRAGVSLLGLKYVLAVNRKTVVGKVRRPSIGRPGLSFWPTDESMSIEMIAENLPESYWHKLTTSPGERGPIRYLWASVRVVRAGEGEGWLLIRQSLSDSTDRAFYFSNADKKTSLQTLAEFALRRASIEQCFAEAKTEAGLDEYEVRLWGAWYRHITLAMMAHALLVSVKKTLVGESQSFRSNGSRHRKAFSDTKNRNSQNNIFSRLAEVQKPQTHHGSEKSL